jgi:hypothetical protein
MQDTSSGDVGKVFGNAPSPGAGTATGPPRQPVPKSVVVGISVMLAVLVVGAVVTVCLVYYFRVKSHCKNQHTVVPAISRAQAAAQVRQALPQAQALANHYGQSSAESNGQQGRGVLKRPPVAALPPGVARTALSDFPVIDVFEGAGLTSNASREPVNVLSPLLGVSPQLMIGPWAVPPTASSVYKAYLSDDEAVTGAIDAPRRHAPQRVATAVVFLGDGGGVRLPYFGHVVRGRRDRVVAWFNVSPRGHADPRTQFAFEGGTHAVIVHWLDQRPADDSVVTVTD